MPKVYLVYDCEEEDNIILAVCATKESAEAWTGAHPQRWAYYIEERDVIDA